MKKYYIRQATIEQTERMLDKMYYWMEVTLFDALCTKNITLEEHDKKAAECQKQIDELEEALSNIKGQGSYKVEWKYIETLKKYASKRDELDLSL